MSKILVIDDEPIILENIKFVLELENYEVITACDGKEGVEAFLENMSTLDTVITDMKMPKATGMEVLHEIKQVMPAMSVIVLTGHGDMENAIEAMKAGAFEYLKKPVNADNLTISVTNAVHAKNLRVENALMQHELMEKNIYLQGLHDSAQKILLNMIPKELPAIDGFRLSAKYRNADVVGGDMFNISDLGSHVCFYVFDVISHGILASVISIILKSFIVNMEYNYRSGNSSKRFEESVSDLNIQLKENTAQNIFASLFMGFIEKKTGRFSYVSAGHIPQYLIRKTGITPLDSTGTVLGIFPEEKYECIQMDLQPGDKILLFTDGITEASSNGSLLGTEGLLKVLDKYSDHPVDSFTENIFSEVLTFCSGNSDDDITLLGLEIL